MSTTRDNLDYAINDFIRVHKPERIALYFDVEEYMTREAAYQPDGRRDIEVSAYDSKSGNPYVVSWHESGWQLAWTHYGPETHFYTKREDLLEMLDEIIDMGDFTDLTVTEFEDGIAQPFSS